MANQFASVSSASAILKNYYAAPIITQFNDSIPFWKQIEKGKEKWNGSQVVRPLKVRRNQGIGATSDGGILPSIGQQTTVQATIVSAYNYLRFGITGPMIKSSQGDKGAFVSIMEYEMEQGLLDLKTDVNRQLQWKGDSTLATVSANVIASTSVTATGRESTEDGNKFLDAGMVIDIVTSAGVVQASGVTISSISGTTTATLVLSSAVTCNSTDLIVRSGSYGQEMDGILSWEDGQTTSQNGVNRSTYPVYQGNAISASGGSLTLNLMQQALNEARRRGDGKVKYIDCDFASERYYNKLLVADKRYVGKVKGDGTFTDVDQSYLEFGGAPVVPDKDCPTRFFFIDPTSWKKYVLAELEWADETGSYMIAQTSADAFEVRLRFFADLFCEKPSANAALKSYISP